MPRGRDRRAAADGGGAKRGGWRRRAAAAADESSAPKRARKNGVAAVVGATAATATAAAAAPAAAPAAAAAAGAGARAGARPRLQLITANVGSVFEDKTQKLAANWVGAFAEVLAREQPVFVALHFQEIGGKTFEGARTVAAFVEQLQRAGAAHGLTRSTGWIDSPKEPAAYTALGVVYLVHKSLADVQIWNHDEREFVAFSDAEASVHIGTPSPFFVKTKFKQGWFGVDRPTRKGFLRTRWRISGRVYDLVNVHLFHDMSNLKAADRTPSVYSEFRRQALDFVMESVLQDPVSRERGEHQPESPAKLRPHSKRQADGAAAAALAPGAPSRRIFFFGDMNFRLALGQVVMHLCGSARPTRRRSDHGSRTMRRVYHRRGSGDLPMLTLEQKKFEVDDSSAFLEGEKNEFLQYDREALAFSGIHELPINFPPTYPFSEKDGEGDVFMRTRCPAWCDRVLMPKITCEAVEQGNPTYARVGSDVCMGDHKPVYLAFSE